MHFMLLDGLIANAVHCYGRNTAVACTATCTNDHEMEIRGTAQSGINMEDLTEVRTLQGL